MCIRMLATAATLLSANSALAVAGNDDAFADQPSSGSPESNKDAAASGGAVVANPLALIFGLVNAELGIGVTEDLSLNVGGTYWHFEFSGVETTAMGAGIGAQYFLTGDRYAGAFLYPTLEYAYAKLTYETEKATGSLAGPAAMLGYQWDWKPFTLRVAGGARYFVGSVSTATFSSNLQGAAFKADTSLGLTWQ